MTDKIIIVEDDAALAAGLGRALASEQRDIRICGRLADAEKLMTGSVPVLVILDVNLLCHIHLPIIVLSFHSLLLTS